MKRVLILVNEFPPLTGGIAAHAWQLAGQLASRGHVVQVLCWDRAEGLIVDHSFKVKRLQPSAFYLLSALNRIRSAWKLMHSFRPEVVIVSNSFALWLGWLMSFFFRNMKFIGVLHGSELLTEHAWKKKLTSLSLHRMDQLVAVSSYTSSLLKDERLIRNSILIPNGLSDEWLSGETHYSASPRNSNKVFSGKLILLTVGTIRKRKGHADVIRALPRILQEFPQAEYWICGMPQFPRYLEELHALAREHKVTDHIHFISIPFHETERLKQLYRTADVFLLLSRLQPGGDTEGFGISILEANACGLPAIGTRACGIEEVIRENENGLLVEAGNTEQLLQALRAVVSRYPHLSDGAVRVAATYPWTSLVRRYEELF